MDQSELIKSIKDIAASAEPDKISKLIGIINNKYFKNIIRSCAIIELGKIKDKNALEFLIARLKKEDEDLKEEIISAIGAIGDKSAYFNLKIILDDEKQSIDLRIAAALALFELGYHEETEEILKKLRAQLREKRKITKDIFISDNSKIIEAIRNLLKSSAPDRSLKLQNIIKNRYFNNYIRSSALKALREFKDSSNKDFLIGLLNDPNENLKEEIISVLAAFGDKSVYSILNKILVNTNEKMELRIAAALGLYELGFEKETEPILKKLREQIKSKQIKKAGEEKSIDQQKEKEVSAPQSSEQQKINEFIKIIRQIAANPKDAHSSEKLETIIKNKFLNNYIRSEAIIQLGKMKSVRSIDFLIERLKDKNEPLKEQVIWALAAIGNVKVYKELNNILMDNAERIEWRIAAALGLYELGFKKETEEILKNLREKLKEYRTLNKTELDNIFQSRAIEMIKKLAKSKDMNKIEKLQNIIANKHFNDNIRTQAIIELGNLKSFASVKILVNFLKNPTETLKEQIIWALGMIGGEIAIEQLKEILYDNQISIDLRISAALALYNAGEKNTAEPILKQLRGKYSKHREKKSKHKTEEIKIDELTENDIIPNINYEDKVMFILLGNINDDHIVRLKNSLILIAKKEPTKRIYVNLSDVTDIRLQHFKKIYEFLLHNPELKEKLVIVCAVEKIMNMIEESGFFKNIPVIEGIKND